MPEPAVSLTGKQRRHLRSLGHHLDPVVMVGKDGVSDAVVAALEQALLDHELVKIKINQNAVEERKDVAEALSAATGSAVAQILGATLLLYRPHPDEPQIRLP